MKPVSVSVALASPLLYGIWKMATKKSSVINWCFKRNQSALL